MARRNQQQRSRRRRQQNQAGALGGPMQQQADLPQNPNHFLNRYPSFQDYTQAMQGHPNRTPLTRQQYGGLQPRQGGGGGGGNQNIPPIIPPAQNGAINPPATNAPGSPGAFGGINPTLGNNYGGTFQSYQPGSWQAYSGPEPAGLAQGSFFNPEANDTERFTYDTFAGGQTYKPMPTAAAGGPTGNYPFQGYAPPPSNVGYFNQGQGWNWPSAGANYQQMTWDQYAQAMQGMSGDIQPHFRQTAAPSAAQNVWWANPVITDPGYYDPWVELRNLQQHFGGERGGSLAQDVALGTQQGGQGQLDYYRYLAHQAGIPGYAQLTGPLAPGYHSPNIGGTYGAT